MNTNVTSGTVGIKGVYWGGMMAELVNVLHDLRYMFVCSIVLILADLWWGYSEAKLRRKEAQEAGNATLADKYKWRFSRAARRTANKTIDYLTYLAIGAFVGLAVTEPMDICSHVWASAMGLGIGCACEIASIVGHVAYVKMGIELSLTDAWRAFIRFLGRLIKAKSEAIGEAVEGLGRGHHYRQYHEPEVYDEEQNMED